MMRRTVRPWLCCLSWLVCLAVVHFADASSLSERLDALQARRMRLIHERAELEGYLQGNVTQQGAFRPVREQDPRLDRALRDMELEAHPFYPNVSGFYHGHLSAWNTSRLSWDQVQERGLAEWNNTVIQPYFRAYGVTDQASHIRGGFSLPVPWINGSLDDTDIQLVGVHDIRHGMLYLVGMPVTAKAVLDIRNVLAMIPETQAAFRNDAGKACLNDINMRIQRIDEAMTSPYTISLPDPGPSASSNCTMQLYAKLSPEDLDQRELNTIEHELREPSGIVTRPAPRLHMKVLGISTRCGMYLETDSMVGISRAQYWSDVRYYIAGMICVLLMQLVLMTREMERTQTHTAISRISGLSMFIHSLFDACMSLAHFILGLALPGSYAPGFFSIAFMQAVLFFVLEFRLYAIVTKQRMESHRGTMQRVDSLSDDDDNSFDSLLDEPTLRHYIDNGYRRVRRALHRVPRMFFLVSWLMAIIFFVNVAPVLYTLVAVSFLMSFWVPQILHNIRQRSTGFHTSTIIGMSMARCYVPLYLYQDFFNPLPLESTPWFWLLMGWCAAQTLFLVGQNMGGPLFFLPYSWRHSEKDWNWHPSKEALAAMLSHTHDEEEAAVDPLSIPLGDCPICLMPTSWDDESVMVAPCHHVFHKECLLPWLDIKQICPSCRLPLPVYNK